MNILNEINDLRDLFIKFCDDIIEDNFIYKNGLDSHSIDLTGKNYFFNIRNENNFNLFKNKLTRINTLYKTKESFLDDVNGKKLNLIFKLLDFKIKNGTDLKSKVIFKETLLMAIKSLYLVTSNIQDIIFKNESNEKNINIGTLYNHGNFSIENNGVQSIQINKEIDKIIELLEKKDFHDKEKVKILLVEFKKTQDKNKLGEVLSILGNIAGIGSLITSIIALIK